MDDKYINEFLNVSMLGKSYKTVFGYDNLSDSEKINLLLNVSLFGKGYRKDLTNEGKIDLAIKRAYRDFCRTIDKDKLKQNKYDLNTAKDAAVEIITNNFKATPSDKVAYNKWFFDLCTAITNIGYSFGQAQKWVNMTMKYLIVLDYEPFDQAIIKCMHAPIDTDIVHHVIDENHWDDYLPWSSYTVLNEKKYKELQKKIVEIKKEGICTIEWEFDTWNKKE